MKLSIKYGSLIAAGSFLWLVCEYLMGFRTTNFNVHIITWIIVPLVLSALGLVLAIRERKTQLGPAFHFKQGFITGLAVSFIAGLLMVFGQYIYLRVIDTGYIDRAKSWSSYIEAIDGISMEESDRSSARESKSLEYNLLSRSMSELLHFLVQGAVVSSVISAVIIRKKQL